MNILFVTPYFVWPGVPHAGGQDIFNYIKWLSQKHNICLLSFIEEGEKNRVSSVSPFCKWVKTVPSPIIPPQGRLSLRKFLLLFKPNYFVFSRSGWFAREIKSLCETFEFDLIQFEYFQTAQYLFDIPFKRYQTILDEHAIASKVLERELKKRRGWEKYLLKYQIILHKRWEQRIFATVNKILVRSETDKTYLENFSRPEISQKVSILSPMIHDDFLTIPKEKRERGNILFFGAMDIVYNWEAALHFAKNIFPSIKDEIKEARFFIVGNNPPESIKRIGNGVDIIVTGYVRNVLDYFCDCEVFVAPLRNPGGILVKILQAFASGRPVVAFTEANLGIGAKDGEEIVISDSPNDFSEKVISLMRSQSLWEKIAEGGRDLFSRKFSYERTISMMDRIYS